MAFGRNEIAPSNSLELFLISFYMITSAMYQAYIFGTIFSLVSSINVKSTQFEWNLDTSNTSMTNLKLPVDIRVDVRGYIQTTFNN